MAIILELVTFPRDKRVELDFRGGEWIPNIKAGRNTKSTSLIRKPVLRYKYLFFLNKLMVPK